MSETRKTIEEIIGLLRELESQVYRYYPPSQRVRLHRIMRRYEEWLERGIIPREDFEEILRFIRPFRSRGTLPRQLEEKLHMMSITLDKETYGSLKNHLEKLIEQKGKINIVFMLGSGASRPAPSEIPTVEEMLDYLIRNLPPTEIPFAKQMKEWSTRNGVNIEDILTAGYLGTLLVSKPVVSGLVGEIIYREAEEETRELREREYVFSFQDLVNRVFSMVSGLMAKADSNKVHEGIAKMIHNVKDGIFDFSITTTNYDVCIEKAFEKEKLSYSYLGISTSESGSGIPIIKIHGSINWFYCEGCQSVITYSIRELENFKKIFPTSGSCQNCGTSASLFMVPPIAYKYVMFPPLIDIWQNAMNTMEKADIIIVIGYSFSLADDYIFKMMVSGIKKKNSILVVLDRNRAAISNLESKLSAHHLKLSYYFVDDAINSTLEITKILEEVSREKTGGKKVN